ncbi:MAG: helix-turn-helix domain-containing protein [Lentisphaeria bacterium]|nr:helix-turn-helix domain-containing protein [Lentisphaeria bacterium]
MILSGTKINRELKFEKVANSNSATIITEMVAGNPLPCNYHYHYEMELTFINSGSGKVFLGGNWYDFKPGSIFLIGKNTPHYFVSIADSSDVAKAIVIKFNSNFSNIGLLGLPEFNELKQLFESAKITVIFQDNLGYEKILSQIHNTENAQKIMILYGFLLQLAANPYQIVRENEDFSNLNVNQQKTIEKAMAFLQKNFTRKITLEEAAKSVRMESESFRRFFKKTARMNFSQYLLELRIACACRLLQESKLSISEVAINSGFNNLSNFNRQFLAKIKNTPRSYRLSCRSANE